jgi:hypothetical protein
MTYLRGIRALPLLVVLTAPLAAQSIIVGTQHATANFGPFVNPPTTVIDLTHPATKSGTVTRASVTWMTTSAGTACTNAFKVKFFRPAPPVSSPASNALTTFTLIAERGPFTSQNGSGIVPLSPGVTLQPGDFIGVTSLVASQTCGTIGLSKRDGGAVMAFQSDLGNGSYNGTYTRDVVLLARATDGNEVLEGVIPGAGSLQGGFGASFRTSVQLTPGPRQNFASGKLVFRRAGTEPSPNDPAATYSINDGSVVSWNDIVQTMGTSGLGSIDVISTSGAPPIVTARVYNDAGAAGTSGFTEDFFTRDEALDTSDVVTFMTPTDLSNFRVNIGVRTFSEPVKVFVEYGTRGTAELNFPANYFQQYALATFTSIAPQPNERMRFTIFEGNDVVIYASITDNRTNDSAAKFLRRE